MSTALRIVLTGASSGIGRELARQFGARGARLVLAARSESRLEAVARESLELGAASAFVVPTDVTSQPDCAALIDRAAGVLGGVDVLINNAGVSQWARFDEITDLSVFERLMRVNYLGAVWCTHAALPHLAASRGRIVAVSSLAGLTGVPTHSGYAATKHAMTGFFESLRVELAEAGVTVTLVHPGFVSSDIRRNALGPDGTALEGKAVREGRVMSTEECARRIVRATLRRDRQVVMTWRGKVGRWAKLVAPGIVDRIAARAIRTGE